MQKTIASTWQQGSLKPDTAHSMSHQTYCPKVTRSIPENTQFTVPSQHITLWITGHLTGRQPGCHSQLQSVNLTSACLMADRLWQIYQGVCVPPPQTGCKSLCPVKWGSPGRGALTAAGGASLWVKILVLSAWRSFVHVAGWEMGNELSGQWARTRVGFKDTAVCRAGV